MSRFQDKNFRRDRERVIPAEWFDSVAAAINFAATKNYPLRFTRKTYDCTGLDITIPGDLYLIGEPGAVLDGGTRITMQGGTIDGLSFTNWSGGAYLSDFAGHDLTIKNCEFDGCYAAAYTGQTSDSLRLLNIDNCLITNGQFGFYLRCGVNAGAIDRVNINGMSGTVAFGIAIGYSATEGLAKRLTISRCNVRNISGDVGGSNYGIMVYGEKVSIDRNTVSGITGGSGSGIYTKANDVTISKNKLFSAATSTGYIAVKGAADVDRAIITENICMGDEVAEWACFINGSAVANNNIFIMPNGNGIKGTGFGNDFLVATGNFIEYGLEDIHHTDYADTMFYNLSRLAA